MFENVTCFLFHTKTTFSATENIIFGKQSLKCLVTSFFSSSLEGENPANVSKTLGSGWCHCVMSTRFAPNKTEKASSVFKHLRTAKSHVQTVVSTINLSVRFQHKFCFQKFPNEYRRGFSFVRLFVYLALEQIPNVKTCSTWLFCTVRYDTGNLLQSLVRYYRGEFLFKGVYERTQINLT